MQLRGPIFQNFPTPGQNTSIPPHQCSGAMGAPAHVPPKENLLPPLTSENKRPKLKNTRANRSHKMFDARLMRIDLIISRKAFPPLLESFSFPLSTWRPSSFVDQSKKQHDHYSSRRYYRFVRILGAIQNVDQQKYMQVTGIHYKLFHLSVLHQTL